MTLRRRPIPLGGARTFPKQCRFERIVRTERGLQSAILAIRGGQRWATEKCITDEIELRNSESGSHVPQQLLTSPFKRFSRCSTQLSPTCSDSTEFLRAEKKKGVAEFLRDHRAPKLEVSLDNDTFRGGPVPRRVGKAQGNACERLIEIIG